MSQSEAKPQAAKLEQAYRELRRAIEAGEYTSNEHLVEQPLTESLGISRNTLRAVLARLENEGFIQLEPNRGARVRAFSREEAYDVLRVREVLEGLAARLAAERLTADERTELASTIELAQKALRDDDLQTFTKMNRRFHVVLIEAARSPMTASMLDSLHFPMMKYQFQSMLVPGRKLQVCDEHEAVLAAIVRGDGDEAERVARWHVGRIRDTLQSL